MNTNLMFGILSLVKHNHYLESEIHKLENLIKYAPDMIYWKDKNSIHLGCNEQFAIAAGFESKDIIGKSDREFPWHARADKYIADDKEVIATGIPKLNIEDLITVASGKEIVAISNKVPLQDGSGNIIGILGIATDITNQKQLEYELRSSRATLEELSILNNIIKYAPDMIYWKDKNSIHLGGNDQFAIAAGFESKEIIGKSDHDFPWHDQADKYIADDRKVIESGESRLNIEDIMSFKNGKKAIVITNKVPLRNQEGKIIGVLGIATDITHQKNIEQQLVKSKQKAESASHAKTEFIANMSHDIRTPLSGVVGLAAILESQLTDPLHKKEAHDLGQSGNVLLDMLNEILDVVAADNVNTNDIHEGAFNLFDLIHGIINLEQPSVAVKKIQLHSKIDPDIPLVLISDYKKIHHILLNLVGNAIKFTTEGQVDINVTILHRQTEQLTLEFQVIDTGKGIPTEALDNVFDPFFRGTPSYKGLDKGHGLGLHIAQTYVQLLGGKIHVTSKLNEGSVFSFTLSIKIGDQSKVPASIPDAIVPSQPVSEALPSLLTTIPANELSSSAPKILIIEDNPVALMVANTLIKNAHLTTATAVDGESALVLAKTETFDLIVSDVGLPGISGIDFTRQFRAYEREHHLKPVAIVGLTAHAEEQVRQECLEAGMNDVLIKPITAAMVETIITQFALKGL